jgi:hypothetical protein
MSSIAISSSPVRTARATGRGRVARVGLATTVAAVAANTLVYFIGGALVAYDPQFLPLANVSGAIVFTLPAAIVAALIYAALLRFARRPARTSRSSPPSSSSSRCSRISPTSRACRGRRAGRRRSSC